MTTNGTNEIDKNVSLDSIKSSYPDLLSEQQQPLYTILVVDDNFYIRELVTGVLSFLFNIITAEDGVEAIAVAKNSAPDLIVSDVMMPNMDGMEFCSFIKNDIELSHTPLILLTALSDETNNVEGLMKGADDYIVKPFNPMVLTLKCANLIRSRKKIHQQFNEDLTTTSEILTTNPLDQEFLHKVNDIIEKNIEEEDFDINNLCSELAMSRTNVYNKFRALIGNSPNDYILNLKIKKASHMLITEPHLTVFEISLRLGFKTPNYFSKTFKKISGTSPVKYRKDFGVK